MSQFSTKHQCHDLLSPTFALTHPLYPKKASPKMNPSNYKQITLLCCDNALNPRSQSEHRAGEQNPALLLISPPSHSIPTFSPSNTQPRTENTPCFRTKTPEEQVGAVYSFSNASPITPVDRLKIQPLKCLLVIKDI